MLLRVPHHETFERLPPRHLGVDEDTERTFQPGTEFPHHSCLLRGFRRFRLGVGDSLVTLFLCVIALIVHQVVNDETLRTTEPAALLFLLHEFVVDLLRRFLSGPFNDETSLDHLAHVVVRQHIVDNSVVGVVPHLRIAQTPASVVGEGDVHHLMSEEEHQLCRCKLLHKLRVVKDVAVERHSRRRHSVRLFHRMLAED